MLHEGHEPVPGHRLVRRLGHGGFSEVWEAATPSQGRVALKFLKAKNAGNEIRLLQTLRGLSHPHLIEFKNVFATPEQLILSMELADGSLLDLHEAYQEQERRLIPSGQLLRLLGQAAQALDYLAALKVPGMNFAPTGLQHSDIKPSNLLLVEDRLKVGDFGLCAPRVGNLSRKGFSGTPAYAAPEMFEGRVTERSDQYSLAVTYFELRTGRLPFRSASSNCNGARRGSPPDRSSLDLEALSPEERPIVARALEDKWINRWPNCQEFMAALHQAEGALRRNACTAPP